MWISKIELTNFKSYQRQVFSFPELINGKNIVVIGGLNGYGKTSILEALYLCLYGKDAIVHLARAGLKSDDKKGYPTFLERAFNGEALRDGRDMMSVRILINRTKTKGSEITRKWFFRSNGSWTGEEEAIVREVNRDVPDTPRVDGQKGFHLGDFLDEILVPAHVAPFFFFDGEEVKKLADQSRVEQVKQGLEGLLGVVLLRTLAERLKNFEAAKRSEMVSVDESKLNRLAEELSRNETQLKTCKEDATKSQEALERFRGEQESLIERITAAGGGGGDIATVKDLVEEREQFRQKLRDNQKQLEVILAGRLPFHLVPKRILDTFRNQLVGEVRLADWENEKTALEPKRDQFKTTFLSLSNPPIDPALTDAQNKVLETRIESAWASLFFPPPEGCATEIQHDYLTYPQREEALSFLDSIGLGRKEIQELVKDQTELNNRIDELGRKITRLEGIDRDGVLTDLKAQLATAQEKIDELTEHVRADDRQIASLEATVNSQRAEYERERKKLDDSSPVRSIIEKSDRVRRVIESAIPDLFPLKIRELGKAMTGVYQRLAHKHQVDKIEIDDDGTTKILAKTGREITFDRSAGENQIFATALIAALAKVSGVKAPLVVDTPLGRLDSRHRANILRFWTEDDSRQVILLSQDKEIDGEMYKSIEKNVSKTYLLDHIDVGDGIGRTSAQEDKYFA